MLNKNNEIKIRKYFKSKVKSVITVELDHLDPFLTLKRIKKIISRFEKKILEHIIFDVSVCFDGLIPILILYFPPLRASSLPR